ncbi:hypothetical protein AYO38_09715 [bacterium SCGC AG-212-C10]|nr:hypothetical protein AYO38_09715 [bacterium SCGC AG-212-C10]
MPPAFPFVVSLASGAIDVVWPEDAGINRTRIASNGRWPVWNPTRDLIAYSRLEQQDGRTISEVQLSDLTGRHLRTLHETPQGVAGMIAPNLPHYACWSPAGDMLAIVAQGQFGLTLFLSDIDGILQSDPIINGAPLFISWCTDNNFLSVHSGLEFAVVETAGSRATANVAEQAAGFRAAAFSDDANILAYVLPTNGKMGLMRAHFQGTGSRLVSDIFAGPTSLAFRPSTEQLSVCVSHEPDSGIFDEVWMVDLAQDPAPEPVRIARGPFAALWWSPTGHAFAQLVPLQTGDGRYAMQIRDPEGRFLAATEGFLPSPDFQLTAAFFDQYGQSHHAWAPDGSGMLLSGRLSGDAVSRSWGDSVGDYVLYWPAKSGTPLEILCPGQSAFFPPAAKRVHG